MFLLMFKTGSLQAIVPQPEQHQLRVGFIQSAFLGVNHRDAEAAFRVFAGALASSYGYEVDVSVKVFNNADDLAALPNEERPDVVIFESWNYLLMENADWLEPLFLSSVEDQIATRYLLIGQKDCGLEHLENLKGKTLNIFYATNSEPGYYWLQALLREQQLTQPEDFFGRVEYKTEPAAAVLPVFFGKTDTALIAENKLELMIELNPQLSNLKPVVISKPLVSGVTCLNRFGWTSDSFRKNVILAMEELHLSPTGQQILTLFKMDQLSPYERHHLDTMRSLQESILAHDQAKQ